MTKRKFTMLNVRKHLEHVQLVIDGLQKHGMCPALVHELATCSLVNHNIMRVHDEKRKSGNRKDIYVPK